MDRQEELKRLRSQERELQEQIQTLEQSDWYDSGCVTEEPEWEASAVDWEESARHWADEGDWESSSC